jgi:hypothetical protein
MLTLFLAISRRGAKQNTGAPFYFTSEGGTTENYVGCK